MSSVSLLCCPALPPTSACGRNPQRPRRCLLLSSRGESYRRAPVWHHPDPPAPPCGQAWVSARCKCPHLHLLIARRPTARLSPRPATTMALRSSPPPFRYPACLLLIAELAWDLTTSVGIAIRSTPRQCDNQRLQQQTPVIQVIQPRRLPHDGQCSASFEYPQSQDAALMPMAAG